MKCAKCGSFATRFNKDGLPTCSKHKDEKISPPICPECRSQMTLRKSKFGPFWGCSAFPMCDGIKKI
jgi:ribosomal protein L37AE/L43A